MSKISPWKIGIGAGAIILGLYSLFNFQDTLSRILGIIAIAFGLGLIASN